MVVMRKRSKASWHLFPRGWKVPLELRLGITRRSLRLYITSKKPPDWKRWYNNFLILAREGWLAAWAAQESAPRDLWWHMKMKPAKTVWPHRIWNDPGRICRPGFLFAWKWITTKVSQAGIGGLLIKWRWQVPDKTVGCLKMTVIRVSQKHKGAWLHSEIVKVRG